MRDLHTILPVLILLLAAEPAFISAIAAEAAPEMPLDQLLVTRFGKLSGAEEQLASTAANGGTANCRNLTGSDKEVRAELFVWLCTNPRPSSKLTYRGISVEDARFVKVLVLDWARISFPITLSNCAFPDGISLVHSHLANLCLKDSIVSGIDASEAHIEEDMDLTGLTVMHGLSLTAAKIDGTLVCDSGLFVRNGELLAIQADAAAVKGSVLFRDGFAEGGVSFSSATIDEDVDCDGSLVRGSEKVLALNANAAGVKGDITLRSVKADGGVDIENTKIDGTLTCSGGHFAGNEAMPALNVNSAHVGRHALFRKGFKARGTVSLRNAQISGNLDWFGVQSPQAAILDLRRAKAGTLVIDSSWPQQGNLLIDGFVYDQIGDVVSPSADFLLAWLGRQPNDRFVSQPFEQLAAVLRKMGLEEDARKVLIAKNNDHERYVRWRPEWLWYGCFGRLINFGYTPWNAFYASLVVVLFGTAAFRNAYLC